MSSSNITDKVALSNGYPLMMFTKSSDLELIYTTKLTKPRLFHDPLRCGHIWKLYDYLLDSVISLRVSEIQRAVLTQSSLHIAPPKRVCSVTQARGVEARASRPRPRSRPDASYLGQPAVNLADLADTTPAKRFLR